MVWWHWVLIVFGSILGILYIGVFWDNIIEFIKKPRTNKAKLLKDLDSLSYMEQTLGSIESLESGLVDLIKQFELTNHILTDINIRLSKHINECDPLQIQVFALRELYDEFLIGAQQEKVDLLKFNQNAEQNGTEKGSLLISNTLFLRNYNKQLNYRIQSINTAVNNILILKNKRKIKNNNKFKHSSLLSKEEQLAYSVNSELYCIIFTFENLLRKFIFRIAKENNIKNITTWFNKEALDTLSKVKQEEIDNKWTSRGSNELFYIELKHLKDIICNHWKLFSKYFKKQDSFKNKVDTIYGVRCKVAHNSLSITENEITLSKIYIDEILTIIR